MPCLTYWTQFISDSVLLPDIRKLLITFIRSLSLKASCLAIYCLRFL